MCGIYSVIGSTTPQQKVFAGLKRLEYRGYDSWGVAWIDSSGSKIEIEKQVGKLPATASFPDSSKDSRSSISNPSLLSSMHQVSIGHTRWATHGGVTQVNAHPHLSSDGKFALVQNGVVENMSELKTSLLKDGFKFISQTDTEVIVRLIERELKKHNLTQLTYEILLSVFRQLAGRNTIAVLTNTGEVFAIRDGSPLIVGRNKGRFVISSDVLSMQSNVQEFVALESGEGVALSFSKSKSRWQLASYDLSGLEKKTISWQKVEVTADNKIDKGGFDHFMLKEIMEQPTTLKSTAVQDEAELKKALKIIKQSRVVYCLGSGGASYSASEIAYLLRKLGVMSVELQACEALTFKKLWSDKDVAIVISQSGESADTLEVVEWMKSSGMQIITLVNMSGSSIARLGDTNFPLGVGPEIAVASTKAMSGQIVWGLLVAQLFNGLKLEEFKEKLNVFSYSLSIWLNDQSVLIQLKKIASDLAKIDHSFVLGKGELLPSAKEFALKLKEIAYLHAEAFSAGELKHGPIALIDKKSVVFCLVAQDEHLSDVLNAAAQVKSRGARVIGVGSINSEYFDEWIKVPGDLLFAPIACFVPAQLLTYYLALLKGNDADKPRNLAKSVTVK